MKLINPFRTVSLSVCLMLISSASFSLSADEMPESDGGDAGQFDPVLAAEPADGDQLFEQGRRALFQGRFDDAVRLLRDAVAADPDQSKTIYRLHLARALRYAGQPGESEKLLKAILQQSPDHVEAGQLLAEVLYQAERWQDLKEVLEPLLNFRHDYPTYHMLAEATFHLDDYQHARDYYKEAIKLNPASAADHYQLANLLLAENRFALAAKSYERSIALGIDSSVLHYKLASAYFNLRNYFGRVAEVNVVSGMVGQISEDWYLIESVPGKRDAFLAAPKSSAIFQIAKALDKGLDASPDVRMLLANTYLNARRYDRAYEIFQQLSGQVAQDDRALLNYYFAQSALGVSRYDEYVEHLSEAAKLDPEAYQSALVDAYLTVAEKYNQSGLLNKYIENLTYAVEQRPQAASLHLKLAGALEEARRYEEAIIQWRMVLDLEPDHPQRTQLINSIKQRS